MKLADLFRKSRISFSSEIVPDLDISGIAYDSRQVQPGNVFLAIPGLKQNGMQFIPDAIARGAVAVICEGEANIGVPLVTIPNARQALADLSSAFFDFPARKLQLIGITGTNGKTTTSTLLESVLKKDGRMVGVIGTTGARVGISPFPTTLTTPESYDIQKILWQMVGLGVQTVVMEVSSHALSLERVRGCEFWGGVFTNLTHDHLDFHGNMENYFLAKSRLFREYIPWSRSGVFAAINAHNTYGRRLIEDLRGKNVVVFSAQRVGEGVSGKIVEMRADAMRGEIQFPTGRCQFRTPLLGEMNLENLLAAAAAAWGLRISLGTIREGIEAVTQVPGRFERIRGGQPFDVIVDFAHTPDGLEKLLGTVRTLPAKRLLLLFGCPGDRDKEKRPLMGQIASRMADFSVITTDDPHGEAPESIITDIEKGFRRQKEIYRCVADRRAAIRTILEMADPGDWVILAGRGHETHQDFEGKMIALDDRTVAREILSERYNSRVVKSA